MQFLMDPGLTILVPARICAGFWGTADGGGPMGVGPPRDVLLGGNGGIVLLPFRLLILILYESYGK